MDALTECYSTRWQDRAERNVKLGGFYAWRKAHVAKGANTDIPARLDQLVMLDGLIKTADSRSLHRFQREPLTVFWHRFEHRIARGSFTKNLSSRRSTLDAATTHATVGQWAQARGHLAAQHVARQTPTISGHSLLDALAKWQFRRLPGDLGDYRRTVCPRESWLPLAATLRPLNGLGTARGPSWRGTAQS